MINNTEAAATLSIAQQFMNKGYDVTIGPDPSLIPFSLNGYRPDLLAKSNNENIIIEVKSRNTGRTIERYKELAEIIGNHPGWRFMLTTVDNAAAGMTGIIGSELNAEVIARSLAKIDKLFETENFDIALPYLWNVYISGMRLHGQSHDIPVDVTNDNSVLNYMYSLGELSHEEFELSRDFLKLRNELVHALERPVSRAQSQEYLDFVRAKLQQWKILNGGESKSSSTRQVSVT